MFNRLKKQTQTPLEEFENKLDKFNWTYGDMRGGCEFVKMKVIRNTDPLLCASIIQLRGWSFGEDENIARYFMLWSNLYRQTKKTRERYKEEKEKKRLGKKWYFSKIKAMVKT